MKCKDKVKCDKLFTTDNVKEDDQCCFDCDIRATDCPNVCLWLLFSTNDLKNCPRMPRMVQ